MRKMMICAAAFVLAVLLLVGQGLAAQAAFGYEEIEAEIPVGGTGTFRLIPAGGADDEILEEIEIEDHGAFTQHYIEPDDYEYEIYSPDELNVARYHVLVRVVTNEENKLIAYVVVTQINNDRKLPAALYPVPVDPPIAKKVTGETPPKAETFEFVFRAVSTTVEELKGKMPMPEGSDGQTKIVRIVGAGESAAGAYYFDRAGEYVYEFTEHNTGVTGYTYDKSVYVITYTVTETAEGLKISERMTKDGVETTDYCAVFTNNYRWPGKPGNPMTGDASDPLMWTALGSVSVLMLGTLVTLLHRRKSEER